MITPADLETCLASLGVPVARFLAASQIARSTWSDWRAGRTKPRPDRWAAAKAAFVALVAEATPVPLARGAVEPVTLTGSSAPTGAPPSFVPIATANPETTLEGDQCRPSALAEGTGADPIEGLHEEWKARRNDFRAGGFADEHEDAMFDRIIALEERVVAARTTTLAGAITSLEWARNEIEEFKTEGLLGDRLILALLDGALGVLRQREEGTSAPAAPAEVTALTAEWLVSGSAKLHAAAAYDASEASGPEWEAVQARYHAADSVNKPVLERIAALRSCHPDALALKAAVVVRGFEGEAKLQKNIEDGEEVPLNPLEVSVALSIARDLARDLGQVRLLTAAIAADPSSAATGAAAAEIAPGAPIEPAAAGPVTLEQAAELDFEPFDFAGWAPDTNAEWAERASSVLVIARMAYRFLTFGKAEAIEFMAKLKDGEFPGIDDEGFFDRVDGVTAFFETYAKAMDAARFRICVAAASLAVQRDGEATARSAA